MVGVCRKLAEFVASNEESIVEFSNNRFFLFDRSLQRLDFTHQHLVTVVLRVARAHAEAKCALAHRFLCLTHALREQEVEG